MTINQGSNGSNSKTAVIPIPVPVGGGNKKEVRELEDSLARMQVRQDQMAAEIARLTRDSTTVLLDSSVTSTDTTFVAGATTVLSNDSIASVDSTMVEIPFDRLTYDRHNATLNDLMLDRIGLLEMYLSLQEQEAPDSVRYDLEQQVQLLDAQVAALRDSIAALHFQGEVEPDKATLKSDSLRIHTNRASTDTLFFSSGSRYVQDRYRERLRMIAVDFLSQGKGKLIVTGHSDRSGKATFNLTLSQQRAEAVAKVLREAGVPDSAMTVKGLGEKLAQSTYNVKERNVVVQMVILD
jgi:outer membrane protein OmpA-like peptidoglycan-associated protein